MQSLSLHARSRSACWCVSVIEAAISTVILGVGFMAVLELFGSTTCESWERPCPSMIQTAALRHRLRVRRIGQTNRAIRIDDLDDFRRGGSSQPTFNPPIEAGKQHLIGLDDYRQPVRVEPGNPNNLRPVLTAGPYRALRITFEIQRQVKPRQWQTQN